MLKERSLTFVLQFKLFNFLAFKANFGLWNDCLQLVHPNWPFGEYKSGLWILEEHVWIIWHPNVQVCSYSYQSSLFGLFGLVTLKYWNHQLLDTKRSQKHEKIIKFSYSSPVAFEMAFTTFVGLFWFLMDFWCLIRPVVQDNVKSMKKYSL